MRENIQTGLDDEILPCSYTDLTGPGCAVSLSLLHDNILLNQTNTHSVGKLCSQITIRCAPSNAAILIPQFVSLVRHHRFSSSVPDCCEARCRVIHGPSNCSQNSESCSPWRHITTHIYTHTYTVYAGARVRTRTPAYTVYVCVYMCVVIWRYGDQDSLF